MTVIIKEIIAEVTDVYHKMSVLELLAEENMMAKCWYRRRLDPARKRIQTVLRSEIMNKLR